MGGHLLMSGKERIRKVILEGVQEGRLTIREASARLSISYRQGKRICKRYRLEGDAGLLHKGRSRPSNRAKPSSLRQRAIRRYRERYEGFGPTLACEKLAGEGILLDHETLRRWLIRERLWIGPKGGVRHRAYRERKARFGEMLQLDGSLHRWFGKHQLEACLLNMVDDATGKTLSLMVEGESTEGAMRLLWRWIERFGVPMTLYTDKHNIYLSPREPTLEEALAGQEPLTAFGLACHKLGIKILTAHSPQAKGRVERKHGVFQDRFQKELALQRVKTIEGANAVLQNGFVEDLNRRFAVPPADPADAHRPLVAGEILAGIFCWEEQRCVQNDFTLRHYSRWYQITRDNHFLPKPKSRVTVRTLLDGTVELWFKSKRLNILPIEGRPEKPKYAVKQKLGPVYHPPRNHPWRTPWSPEIAAEWRKQRAQT
ncbi:MAG TPA: ISNCY family transposase [Candidatus Limnocylindrales bacterium]|nr:ISNCY family transposase [Candidatus Limnocylindrales bacterium]